MASPVQHLVGHGQACPWRITDHRIDLPRSDVRGDVEVSE
jgi:hypothetical protein